MTISGVQKITFFKKLLTF